MPVGGELPLNTLNGLSGFTAPKTAAGTPAVQLGADDESSLKNALISLNQPHLSVIKSISVPSGPDKNISTSAKRVA